MGQKLLRLVNGMFPFSVYDENLKVLLFARYRAGERNIIHILDYFLS